MASYESDFDTSLGRGGSMTVPSNRVLLQRERRSLMRRDSTGSADSTTWPNAGGVG